MSGQKLEKLPYGVISPLENNAHFAGIQTVRDSLRFIKLDKAYEGSNALSVGDLAANCGGVPIVYDSNGVYVDSADNHTLIIGSTGSKKTRLVVLPTCKILGAAQESMIISDPKAEIYHRTAKELKDNGYKLIVINFREPSLGNQWNPFHIPNYYYQNGNKDRAYEFINDIATNLITSEMSQKDPFWDRSASDLFFGLSVLAMKLYGAKREVSATDIIQLRNKMFHLDGTIDHELHDIVMSDIIIRQSLNATLEAPRERTRPSILATFDQKIRFFAYQQDLLDMMSENTISLDEIGVEKTVVYLIMPDEKTSLHPLISLFIKQSYEYLIHKAQKIESGTFATRINYILDEFSELPTIKDFPAMITAARSRNIRFILVVQSQNQLVARYEHEASTIESNCSTWIFLTSRERQLLNDISAMCGTNAKNEPLISLFALQHLDKERGQALILSGRMYPFITELKDISFFDNEQYIILPFEERESNALFKDTDILSNDGFIEENTHSEDRKYTYLYDAVNELSCKFGTIIEEVESITDQNQKKEKQISFNTKKVSEVKEIISCYLPNRDFIIKMIGIGLGILMMLYSAFPNQIYGGAVAFKYYCIFIIFFYFAEIFIYSIEYQVDIEYLIILLCPLILVIKNYLFVESGLWKDYYSLLAFQVPIITVCLVLSPEIELTNEGNYLNKLVNEFEGILYLIALIQFSFINYRTYERYITIYVALFIGFSILFVIVGHILYFNNNISEDDRLVPWILYWFLMTVLEIIFLIISIVIINT